MGHDPAGERCDVLHQTPSTTHRLKVTARDGYGNTVVEHRPRVT